MALVNGANGKKVEWSGYIRATWAILAFILAASFYLGGRLESPAQKERRTEALIKPHEAWIRVLEKDVEQLKAHVEFHRRLGGHDRMEEKMKSVERDHQMILRLIEVVEKMAEEK